MAEISRTVPEPSLLLVHATAGYDHAALLDELATLAPKALVSGCSAEGIVTQGRADELDHVVGVLGLTSDVLRFTPFLLEGYGDDPRGAARSLAAEVRAADRGDSLALVLLPDGLSGDCSAFLEELWANVPHSLQIVGGAAADALRMEQTHQFLGRTVVSKGLAALLIAGEARIGTAIGHGCRPIGRTQTITRAEGGWVHEIDGRPAWEQFRSYLDGDPQDLHADGIMHLSVGFVAGDDTVAVRTPLLLRKEDGALFFPGGGLTLGTRLRIVRRDAENIRQSALANAETLREAAPGVDPLFVLQFDCCGRGKLLFGASTVEQIIDPVQHAAGRDVPWLGFHTYGEIGSVRGEPRYHNYTVTFLAVFPR